MLDALVAGLRQGQGRSLVLQGEAGIGKSALLEYLAASASASGVTVVRVSGVESELELAYASLHQFCQPLQHYLARLADPQRRALEIVFGQSTGPPPDRLHVGLAVLGTLAEASDDGPLLCLVDDAQWLDDSSAQALAFVARRLVAEPVAMVFAAREPGPHLRDLPALEIGGLRNDEAHALFDSALRAPVDDEVRRRIFDEARGNPLALLELPRGLTPEELAGFGPATLTTLQGGVEETFRRRLAGLPEQTQQLLLLAAADPLGDVGLLWQAAALQGITAQAAVPATEADLCAFDGAVRFRHPLVRTASYASASLDARREAHAVLAEVTPDAYPEHRAWHRALACDGLDDAVADELERSAIRARARGGQPAAAAFLERSFALTADRNRRAARAVEAAEARHLAGSANDALRLAAIAESEALGDVEQIRLDALRARVATTQRRAGEAPPLLLEAAQRVQVHDVRHARDTYRDALIAAVYAGAFATDVTLSDVAAAICSVPPGTVAASAEGDLLDAAARLIQAGVAVGAPSAKSALARWRAEPLSEAVDPQWQFFAVRVLAPYLWDAETWDLLSSRMLEAVRGTGVVALLPMALAMRVGWELYAGNLDAAAVLVAEQDTVQEAIGGDPSPGSLIALAAFRGREAEVVELDHATTSAARERGDGAWLALRDWSLALLNNGLGRYDEALDAAQRAVVYPTHLHVANWALSELIEAAARCGRPEAASDAQRHLAEMAGACQTDWVLGVEARARALLADPREAEPLYRQAVEHLARTPLRTELARTQLQYGEYLRREGRRVDARIQLRAAEECFASAGMAAFAERTRRELKATGEISRKRGSESRDDLTLQERQIAEMAGDGLSNPEIGARLFLSRRTVEWHLRHVFAKLGIASRRELPRALGRSGPTNVRVRANSARGNQTNSAR